MSIENREIFRGKANVPFLIGLLILIVGFNVAVIYDSKVKIALATALWSALVIAIYCVFLLKPKVVMSDSAIEIYNPAKRFSASWNHVEEIFPNYTLGFLIDQRLIQAWAITSPGSRPFLMHAKKRRSGSTFSASTSGGTYGSRIEESVSYLALSAARQRIENYERIKDRVDFGLRQESVRGPAIVTGLLALAAAITQIVVATT